MRERLIAICGLAGVLLGACGSAAATPVPLSAPGAAPAEAVDDVLDLVCLANATLPNDHRAAAQADGVHFRIVNGSGRRLVFEIEGIGGENVPKKGATLIWPVQPGFIGIRCRTGEPGNPPWVRVEVLDPTGVAVADRVTCSGGVSKGIFDFESGARGEAGDPVVLARRRYPGIRAGDVVERAGYAVPNEQKVRVVRDGIIEIVVTYRSDGAGGWLVDGEEVCYDDMPR